MLLLFGFGHPRSTQILRAAVSTYATGAFKPTVLGRKLNLCPGAAEKRPIPSRHSRNSTSGKFKLEFHLAFT